MKCGVGKLSWVLMVAGLRAFHAGSNANLSEAQAATPPPEQVALRAHAHAMVACGNGLRLAVFLASTFSASAQHMRTTRARLELWGALAALHACACERVCVRASPRTNFLLILQLAVARALLSSLCLCLPCLFFLGFLLGSRLCQGTAPQHAG